MREGAGHGARADQDDLRRFLQDRSPRVSSVRECAVGWLLPCSVARTAGADTLLLLGLVTRTSVLNTLLSAVNHGSVLTRAAGQQENHTLVNVWQVPGLHHRGLLRGPECRGWWTVAGTLYDTSHGQVHSSILAAYHGYNCEVLDSGSLLDMLADLHSAKRKQFCNVCQ